MSTSITRAVFAATAVCFRCTLYCCVQSCAGLQGFEPLGMLSKAASGIASTTTTMATSLDEAMENFFEGWTPAPPAADHTSYHCSPYHRYQHHSNTAAHQLPCKVAALDVRSAHHEEDSAQSNQEQGANDDWEEWDSPFQSRSTSPNMENQDPNDSRQTGSGILAWRSPGRKNCEAKSGGLWGANTCQKHSSGMKAFDATHPDLRSSRYSLLPKASWIRACPQVHHASLQTSGQPPSLG